MLSYFYEFYATIVSVKYLEELNDRQKEAVLHIKGPLLVFAGAGAGKTKTITHRILHLIKGGVSPESILAVTFTNKAAEEMRGRVKGLLGKDAALSFPSNTFREGGPEIRTFHSLGVLILKKHAGEIGNTKNFSIFDKNDSLKAIKKVMKSLDVDPKTFEPKKVLGRISKMKGDLVTVREFVESNKKDFFLDTVAIVWEEYEKLLRENNALDFDDLLLKTVTLLKTNKKILEGYQNKWKFIHVDEYQDTNKVQYEFSKLLSKKNNNICVVGDNDQSIYSWRGADFTNILRF